MRAIDLPRHRFLGEPTLLQRVRAVEALAGHAPLYVKRDDMMPIALGGNKLRSLKYWIGAAEAMDADVVIVAGGPPSNQCRLTAAAAAMVGLDCIVLHNADETETARRASFLNRVLGADVRYLGEIDEARRAEAVEALATDLRCKGRRPYIVGDPALAARGYVHAIEELIAQSATAVAPIRHIVSAGSMGPTEAGIVFGNALYGNPFQIHLISVEYDRAELERLTRSIFDQVGRRLGGNVPEWPSSHVHFHMQFLGAGYAQPTPEAEAAILTFARREGILLEHTYTAKTFAAFLFLARTGVFPDGEGVCAIHTGGVATLFVQQHLFASLQGSEAAMQIAAGRDRMGSDCAEEP